MTEKKTETTISEVAESISKVVDQEEIEKPKIVKNPRLSSLKFWCEACTDNFEIFKKDKDGNLEKQQICTHVIFKEAVFE